MNTREKWGKIRGKCSRFAHGARTPSRSLYYYAIKRLVILASIATQILGIALPAPAAETVPGPIVAEVVSVYDGDTFKARRQISAG
jgi:hypothetical protein